MISMNIVTERKASLRRYNVEKCSYIQEHIQRVRNIEKNRKREEIKKE